ncbi:MAG: hypothetical protein Q9226_005491 [Calogaya cf. arnoldii]
MSERTTPVQKATGRPPKDHTDTVTPNLLTEEEEIARQAAQRRFFEKWEPLVNQRTNGRGTLQKMCKYEKFPDASDYKTRWVTYTQSPYGELDALMAFVESFGTLQIRKNLVSELKALSSSNEPLVFPPELDESEPSSLKSLKHLWKAARLRDFWHQYKHMYKTIYRIALYKEVRVFNETAEMNSRKPSVKHQLQKMYDSFRASSVEHSRLEHSFDRWGYYSVFYSALDNQFHSDGIAAMVPHDYPVYVFQSKARIEAIIDALSLLKPGFENNPQLQVYAQYIDKVYEGGSLTEQELLELEQYSKYDLYSSRGQADEGQNDRTRASHNPNNTPSYLAPPPPPAVSGSVEPHTPSASSKRRRETSQSPNSGMPPSTNAFIPALPQKRPLLGSQRIHSMPHRLPVHDIQPSDRQSISSSHAQGSSAQETQGLSSPFQSPAAGSEKHRTNGKAPTAQMIPHEHGLSNSRLTESLNAKPSKDLNPNLSKSAEPTVLEPTNSKPTVPRQSELSASSPSFQIKIPSRKTCESKTRIWKSDGW